MGWWLLAFLQGLTETINNYIESVERAKHDEMELKILRELLEELKKLIAPLAAPASVKAAEIGEATIKQVMTLMRTTAVTLATYAQDNIADYVEDKGQSPAVAVGASMRLYEALKVLLSVTQSQHTWLNEHLPAQRRITWFSQKPRPFVRPLYLAMQAVELAATLSSVRQEAERAQRDLAQAHHPASYVMRNMWSALAAATPLPTTPHTALAPAAPAAPAAPTAIMPTLPNTPIALQPPTALSQDNRDKLDTIAKNIDDLKKLYNTTLLFVEEFAGQAKKRLEDHTRPGGGISAIIVRAQIALVISFCIHSWLVVEGLHSAIIKVDENIIDI